MKNFLLFLLMLSCLFLSSCDEEENAVGIQITSNISNQIAKIDQFKVDRIVIDVQFENSSSKQLTLDSSLIQMPYQIGMNEAKITYQGFSITTNIYLYEDEISDVILASRDIAQGVVLLNDFSYTPIEEYGFIGWYLDDSLNEECDFKSLKKGVTYLYSKYEDMETVRLEIVNEFNTILFVKYYKKNEEIDLSSIINEEYHFDTSITTIAQNTTITVYNKEYTLYFLDKDGEVFLIKTGTSEELSRVSYSHDGYVFKGWNYDFSHCKSEDRVTPILEEEEVAVYFRNSLIGYSTHNQIESFVISHHIDTYDPKACFQDGSYGRAYYFYNYIQYSITFDTYNRYYSEEYQQFYENSKAYHFYYLEEIVYPFQSNLVTYHQEDIPIATKNMTISIDYSFIEYDLYGLNDVFLKKQRIDFESFDSFSNDLFIATGFKSLDIDEKKAILQYSRVNPKTLIFHIEEFKQSYEIDFDEKYLYSPNLLFLDLFIEACEPFNKILYYKDERNEYIACETVIQLQKDYMYIQEEYYLLDPIDEMDGSLCEMDYNLNYDDDFVNDNPQVLTMKIAQGADIAIANLKKGYDIWITSNDSTNPNLAIFIGENVSFVSQDIIDSCIIYCSRKNPYYQSINGHLEVKI